MSVTLIVGDIHLGKGLGMGRPGIGSALNGRVADQFKLLEWILEQAIENQATEIILTGDICEDVKPDYVLMIYFIQWLKHCELNGIAIHIIVGNHDIKRSGSHYVSALDVIQSAEVSNTIIYKQTETIYNGTVGFTLLPFRDRKSLNCESATEAMDKVRNFLQYEVADIPNTYDKVLIGHMALEGSIIVGDEFDDTANELMCPMSTFEGYDYVWMGHVHRPQVRCKKPHIAHIGSLDLSDFGETDHQKIVVLFDSKSPSKFKEIKVPSRPLRILKIDMPPQSQKDTTETILSNLDDLNKSSSIKDSIIKIEVHLQGLESNNSDRQLIQDTVYNKYGAHFLCNFTESRVTSVIPQEKRKDLDNTITPKAAIKMWMDGLSLDDNDKSIFVDMANEVIAEYEES